MTTGVDELRDVAEALKQQQDHEMCNASNQRYGALDDAVFNLYLGEDLSLHNIATILKYLANLIEQQ